MKKIILIILPLLFLSCDNDYNRQMWETTTVVLDKHEYNGRGVTRKFYLYNGVKAEWYHVSFSLYNKYQKGDTIHAIVLQNIKSKCDTISTE